MTQHSEERLSETEGAPSVRTGARILPFERPQSELQRAIQQRAQETIDLNRERDREKRRPQPLKWAAIFALACIPVALTLGAVDGFLRVFHQVTATFTSMPAPEPQQPAEPAENVQTTPGVVMLEAYEVPRQQPNEAERSATSPAATPQQPPAQAPGQR
jgi:hypothetical protein